jgi:hypothetical protein
MGLLRSGNITKKPSGHDAVAQGPFIGDTVCFRMLDDTVAYGHVEAVAEKAVVVQYAPNEFYQIARQALISRVEPSIQYEIVEVYSYNGSVD